MTRSLPRFLAFTLAGLLGGCAQLGMAEPDWPWNPRQPSSAQQPAPRPRPEPVAQPRPRQPDAARAKTPEAAKPATRPAVTVEKDKALAAPPKLVGLSEEETVDLLGHPSEETEQPPGKVWTYKASGCRLSVHLFPDMDKGGFYALDYTVAEGAKDGCLGKVASEARKKE